MEFIKNHHFIIYFQIIKFISFAIKFILNSNFNIMEFIKFIFNGLYVVKELMVKLFNNFEQQFMIFKNFIKVAYLKVFSSYLDLMNI